MSEIKDGGPAFPSRAYEDVRGGMSLRDWFAGQYLAGRSRRRVCEYEVAAECAYAMADAMLRAREGK